MVQSSGANLVFFSTSPLNNNYTAANLMLLISKAKSPQAISKFIDNMPPDEIENIDTVALIQLISRYKKIKSVIGFTMEAIGGHKNHNIKHGAQHHHWQNRVDIINRLLAKGINLEYDGINNLLSQLLKKGYAPKEYRIGPFLAFVDILTRYKHPFAKEAADKIFEQIKLRLSKSSGYTSIDKLFYKIVSRIEEFDSTTKLFKKMCRSVTFTDSDTYTLLMDRKKPQEAHYHYSIQQEVDVGIESDDSEIDDSLKLGFKK